MSHSSDASARFPINLGLALAAGFSSYWLIERPIRTARQRWEVGWRKPAELPPEPVRPLAG